MTTEKMREQNNRESVCSICSAHVVLGSCMQAVCKMEPHLKHFDLGSSKQFAGFSVRIK